MKHDRHGDSRAFQNLDVNGVKFVGRHHSFIRPSKTKWTSGKLYTNAVLEIQPHRNTLPSLHPILWQIFREGGGLLHCVYTITPNPFVNF